ncbi:cytochrome P450 [Aulographum hederae CBS 113979]|uniref:Cytochrome P450 n=1 Tax=Aulographum hederae CBS 113979 TaxID=1176131 RepID=A0A6G1HDQ0_9PEZI|nr:cytochrome P450 [Aulographum hederae CBS 113979]
MANPDAELELPGAHHLLSNVNSTTKIVLLLSVFVTAYLVHHLTKIDHDPREPPLIRPKIPWIGHILGVIWRGTTYMQELGDKHGYQAYTLPMLSSRAYIVSSAPLAAAVQKSSRVLSFNPLIIEITIRMMGFSRSSSTMQALKKGDDGGKEQDYGMMKEMHIHTHATLGPGPNLEDLGNRQMEQFGKHFDLLAEGQELDFFSWVREMMTLSNTFTLYGPKNPYGTDPTLIDAFWDFEAGVPLCIINVFPSITARKAVKGREKVAKAMYDYYKQGHHKEASAWIQGRIKLNLGHGLTEWEAMKLEVATTFGILGNAVSSSFWLLAYIYSSPTLLAEIRAEVDPVVSTEESADGTTNVISVTKVRERCPLLHSCMREILRLHAPMTSARWVQQDTTLDDTYLLRAGSVVQIAGGVLHADTRVWGHDAAIFNPRRFLHNVNGTFQVAPSTSENGTSEKEKEKGSQVHPAAFRAFGGGYVLCPGRHFAATEMMGFVAAMVARFDIEGLDGKTMVRPEPVKSDFPIVVLKPERDVGVRVKRRSGTEKGGKWRYFV